LSSSRTSTYDVIIIVDVVVAVDVFVVVVAVDVFVVVVAVDVFDVVVVVVVIVVVVDKPTVKIFSWEFRNL